jgi:hypothetical protein
MQIKQCPDRGAMHMCRGLVGLQLLDPTFQVPCTRPFFRTVANE